MRLRCVLLAVLMLWVLPTLAATPVDIYEFDSAVQETRYRALIDEFRCPKCLNTNLSGSDAPIAQDLRRTIHRLLVTDGQSDQDIRDFLQQRYGDFVLYDPPLKPGTWILWGAPVLFLLIGAWVLFRVVRQPARETALSDDQQQKIAEIIRQQRSEQGS
jgi:cytochrome c-type biogenesis protein CcmH